MCSFNKTWDVFFFGQGYAGLRTFASSISSIRSTLLMEDARMLVCSNAEWMSGHRFGMTQLATETTSFLCAGGVWLFTKKPSFQIVLDIFFPPMLFTTMNRRDPHFVFDYRTFWSVKNIMLPYVIDPISPETRQKLQEGLVSCMPRIRRTRDDPHEDVGILLFDFSQTCWQHRHCEHCTCLSILTVTGS